ncbi:MAG: Uracil-DNA glycosylase [Rhodospirillaceae bacterium]|nr:MAG: Uracil-DNA glycosylase [Rhodospirillaceae bacterium]
MRPAPSTFQAGEAPDTPGKECARCPRLVTFREANRVRFPAWHNAPVPSFGSLEAWLLVVGLAPGLRGANRTGRPFTGDFAGELLYATLKAFGLARGDYQAESDDGLCLHGCRITNAVRCVPPENKPLPEEIRACRSFLQTEMAAMPRLRAMVALGPPGLSAMVPYTGWRTACGWPTAITARATTPKPAGCRKPCSRMSSARFWRSPRLPMIWEGKGIKKRSFRRPLPCYAPLPDIVSMYQGPVIDGATRKGRVP